MGRLSTHFQREEFACSCGCGWDTVDARLIHYLEHLRLHYNAPIVINSGCRCKEHNRNVGGSSKSQHRWGKAADIQVWGIEPHEVYKWLSNNDHPGGLGNYDTFTHIDVRDKRARWSG